MSERVVVEFDPDDQIEVGMALLRVREHFQGREDWEITLPTGEKMRLGQFKAGVLEDVAKSVTVTDTTSGRPVERPMEHYELFDAPKRSEQAARILLARAAQQLGAPAVPAELLYEDVMGAFRVVPLDLPAATPVEASGVDPTG